MTPETAPAECSPFAAGNGTAEGGLHSPPAAPASDPAPVAGGDRADVAPWDPCACGHPWLRHDVAEYRGDGSETCCVEGCEQSGCPGKSVARTLDVAEATVALARETP